MSTAKLDTEALRPRIQLALREDLGDAGDVTSNAVFSAAHCSCAAIRAKDRGVLAGGPVARLVFEELDPAVTFNSLIAEGAALQSGDLVATLQGPTRSLLAGERLALNFLQRLSGIATLTRKFVDAAGGRIAICDTRKTTPLWRDLEKYAVACGGGTNHRFGLYDMIMLKDTHADGAGGLEEALRRVRSANPQLRIAAEARDMNEVRAAIAAKVDILMLDNMNKDELREAMECIAGRMAVEITGGVTLENIERFLDLGVDRISIGALTHSAKALDLSMRLE